MSLLLLIPLLPLAAAALVMLLRPAWSGYVTAAGMAGALVCLLVIGPGVEPFVIGETWMRAGSLTLDVSLYLDGLSWWMGVLVATICLLVFVYSIGYVEEHQRRFFALMSFFGASMLTLVLAGTFPLLFAAWEGVGIASFMLIAHHDRSGETRQAARKAFLMTRVGDVGLLIAWLYVLVTAETSSIQPFLTTLAGQLYGPETLLLLALLFLAAALGKSAQLPLSAWLPDAMAGPTPVSALLHSATMVAAGVYLILRLFPLFEMVEGDVLLWIGAVTALAAALVATMQYDLKRILAWSTVSQLGEMMMALGLFAPTAAAFHLTTHAVFKSALFLAAGAVERATGTRDVRELARRNVTMPWTAAVFGACALALAAFPPFAGFWSEEKILGAAVSHGPLWAGWMVVLVALAGIYIGRAAVAVFGPKAVSDEDGEAEGLGRRGPAFSMLLPMVLLGAGAAGIGYALRTPVETLLPFDAPSHQLGLWRWGAVAASALGLTFGAFRAKTPAFGRAPSVLVTVIDLVPRAAAALVLFLARLVAGADRGIDAASAGTAALSRRTAGMMRGAEWILDRGAAGTATLASAVARAVRHPEKALDWTSRGSARAALAFSRGVQKTEGGGFGRGIDRAAYGLRERGGGLSRLEVGKIHRYTLSLFIWVIVAVSVVMILWL